MTKTIINTSYGGYSISKEGVQYYNALCEQNGKSTIPLTDLNNTHGYYLDSYKYRQDPLLIKTVEDLKEKSWGKLAHLEIVDMDKFEQIDEYDGNESLSYNYSAKYAYTVDQIKELLEINNDKIDPELKKKIIELLKY